MPLRGCASCTWQQIRLAFAMVKKKPLAPDPLHDGKLMFILGGAVVVVLLIYVLSEFARR